MVHENKSFSYFLAIYMNTTDMKILLYEKVT